MDLTQFLPQFGNVTFTIAAFIVALSIIVAIHEYGHYIVGRWTGIHAEVFSLGFGPVLYSRRDRHGTKWQVAALPFGGFVKFLGDANAASVGSTEVAEVDKRRTMMGAPLWALALTVVAGPGVNVSLAISVFASDSSHAASRSSAWSRRSSNTEFRPLSVFEGGRGEEVGWIVESCVDLLAGRKAALRGG